MRISLRVRNLSTREDGIVDLESESAALVWLEQRPRYVDVLGLATDGVPAEVSDLLRKAVRPLDDEERELEERMAAERRDAMEKAARDRVRREEEAAKATRASQQNTDPNRVMEIHWTYDGGMEKSDPHDLREIPEVVREAVLAWVRERDEWVHPRGQIVGDARVKVWPGTLAEGADRVESGRFIPVTAPSQKQMN